MDFLKPDLLRSFGIGFALGCAALALGFGINGYNSTMVPSAVAATSR